MANHKKAMLHHGKAATALAAGNYKEAAHHMGHALSALRQNAPASQSADEAEPSAATATETPGRASMGQQVGLRARLSKFKKAAPTPLADDAGDSGSGY